jgi:non-heme chloroperoxidase
MAGLTERELLEIDKANESGSRPVMFVHGLWLLSSSWDRWRAVFEEHGMPRLHRAGRTIPTPWRMINQVTDHYLAAGSALTAAPAVIGHSFGGLIAQKIAGVGGSRATVAIDPAPFRGVLPVSSLKSASPVLGNPANASRAVALTFEQFSYGWANALPEEEARELYTTFHVPASGVPLFQAATANLNPFTEAKVDTKNPERGPLLIISGEKDHTVPCGRLPTRHSSDRNVTQD